MERIISKMLQDYEAGKLTRRQLIADLAACASGTQLTAAKESTFRGVGLNHIAIQVTNIPRSRDFYQKHLGLPLIRSRNQLFSRIGKEFSNALQEREAGTGSLLHRDPGFQTRCRHERAQPAGIEAKTSKRCRPDLFPGPGRDRGSGFGGRPPRIA